MPRNRREKYGAGVQKSAAAGLELPPHAGGSKLYVEDEWAFPVKPGVPIESRRDGDDTPPDISPPNQARHNYPSS